MRRTEHPPPAALPSLTAQLQSLKETFAAKLPGEIEKIKKLRKYVPNVSRAATAVIRSSH